MIEHTGPGKTPVGVTVSPDGSRIYVTNYYSNATSVINAAKDKVTAEFNLGSSIWGIKLSTDGSRPCLAIRGWVLY